MKKAIIICGGVSQGALVLDKLRQHHSDPDFFVWDERKDSELHQAFAAVPKLKLSLGVLEHYTSIEVYIAEGEGSARHALVASIKKVFGSDPRICFPTFIHHTAVVSPTAKIQHGCFIGPHSVVCTHASIGQFVIVNTHAIVEHDCIVHDYVTLNPSSVLMGCDTVASFTTLGANATVRDHCSTSAPHTVVAMGAVVVQNIDPPVLRGFCSGIPVKPIFQSSPRDNMKSDRGVSLQWCYKKPFSAERYMQYLQPSLESGQITNDGPLQAVLASKILAVVQSKHGALLASSGTAALHALCTGWSLKEKRRLKWVTQAFTFPSSIEGPLHGSMVADIDPEWHGPSLEFLDQHKGEFDGVIVTNPFGLQTNILQYELWCLSNKKLLVSDNAATPIGFVDDEHHTCIHDIGGGAIMSFHETKPFGRGEGGVIFAKRDILPFVHQAMNFGYDIPRQIRVPHRACSNWRMSDIAAAAICDHLDFIATDQWEAKLNVLALFAERELECNGLTFGFPIKYPTVLSSLFIKGVDRRIPSGEVLKILHSRNIEAKQYYSPLCDKVDAPKAWELYDTTVCLPFHVGTRKEDLAFAIKLVRQVCNEQEGYY